MIDTYIFISKSGGGKGTQIALLEEYLKETQFKEVFHLEAGEHFRNFFKKNTYSSDLAKKVSNQGELLPSFMAIWGWTEELLNNVKKDNVLIIDGTPRKLDEAIILEEALNFYGRDKVKVIVIDVSDEWAIERMKERKRVDDKAFEARKHRLNWFKTDVEEVIKYFKKNEKYDVIKINGEKSIKEVHTEILEKTKND